MDSVLIDYQPEQYDGIINILSEIEFETIPDRINMKSS